MAMKTLELVQAPCTHATQPPVVYLFGKGKCTECAVGILSELLDHALALERGKVLERPAPKTKTRGYFTCDNCGCEGAGAVFEDGVAMAPHGWSAVKFYRHADCEGGTQVAPRYVCSRRCLDIITDRELPR